MLIEIENLTKIYKMGAEEVHALDGIDLGIERGEYVAIMGASGSGKSTLMNILGCLDVPTSGTYRLDGELVSSMDDDRLAAIRNRQIGFVFQTFNLLPRSDAFHNVELPLIYAGVARPERRHRVEEALVAVGLADRTKHRPNELSGGQRQRVAIARALVNAPSIILADEPTGNLDTENSRRAFDLLQRIVQQNQKALLLVTHNPAIAEACDWIHEMKDGQIVASHPRGRVRLV